MSGESSFKFASRGSGRHQPGRILLIQPGALGDSVLSLAMAGELARHFEGVNIEMLGHMDYVSAFAGRSAVAEVADIDTMPLHHLFGEQGEVSGRMVEYLGGFDGVVSWLGKKGSVFEGKLKKMIKGPVAFIDR